MTERHVKAAAVRARQSLEELQQILLALKEDSPRGEQARIYQDAIIKRFEIAFEYIWKLLKAAVDAEGLEAQGPRSAIQEAFRLGWIEQPELWAEALAARNGSVHDYFSITMPQYLKLIQQFCVVADKSLERWTKRTNAR